MGDQREYSTAHQCLRKDRRKCVAAAGQRLPAAAAKTKPSSDAVVSS